MQYEAKLRKQQQTQHHLPVSVQYDDAHPKHVKLNICSQGICQKLAMSKHYVKLFKKWRNLSHKNLARVRTAWRGRNYSKERRSALLLEQHTQIALAVHNSNTRSRVFPPIEDLPAEPVDYYSDAITARPPISYRSSYGTRAEKSMTLPRSAKSMFAAEHYRGGRIALWLTQEFVWLTNPLEAVLGAIDVLALEAPHRRRIQHDQAAGLEQTGQANGAKRALHRVARTGVRLSPGDR